MAKTLSQIMTELDKSGGYAADRTLLDQQLSGLPTQYAAQETALGAKLTEANQNILQSARGRGLGFSGIPIQEQAQYAATEYAPALANLKTQSEQNRVGILQSLNSLSRDKRTQAQGIYDNYLNRGLQNKQFAEGRRQFNVNTKLQREQMAQQERLARSSGGGGGAGASAGDYLAALMSGSSGGGGGSSKKSAVSKQQQAIYSRAKSLQTLFGQDPGMFNRLTAQLAKGDKAARNVVVTAYKLIGHPDATRLKTLGLR